MFKPSYMVSSFIILDLKIWIKISHSTKSLETIASFTNAMNSKILSRLCR